MWFSKRRDLLNINIPFNRRKNHPCHPRFCQNMIVVHLEGAPRVEIMQGSSAGFQILSSHFIHKHRFSRHKCRLWAGMGAHQETPKSLITDRNSYNSISRISIRSHQDISQRSKTFNRTQSFSNLRVLVVPQRRKPNHSKTRNSGRPGVR